MAYRLILSVFPLGSKVTQICGVKGHQKLHSGITRKRCELDKKFQCNTNRKFGMTFRMEPSRLTSGSQLTQIRGVKGHQKRIFRITQKRLEIDTKCLQTSNRNVGMADRLFLYLFPVGSRVTQISGVEIHSQLLVTEVNVYVFFMRNSSLCVVFVFTSKHLVKTANINTKNFSVYSRCYRRRKSLV